MTLDGANTVQPSFVPVEDGFYEFALTVTDDRGGSDSSVVRVFVGDVDPATCPRADAGTDRTVNEGAAVRLRGGNSADPGGGPLTFDWFQLSGLQVSINGVFIVEPSFVAPQATGADIELEFELTVTNEQGCPDRDTVVITVRDRDPSDPCDGVVCDDDGQFCNGVEACASGACLSNGNPCLADEICNEAAESCTGPPVCTSDVHCDDADVCTDDSCVDGGCVYENNTADCDDGDACTEGSVCADGVCAGNAVEGCCTSDDDCAADDVCNLDTNQCEPAPAGCTDDASYDDQVGCTDDTCDLGTGQCVFTPNDANCANTDFCDGDETCDPADAGADANGCVAGTDPCAAGESCDEDNDECVACSACITDDDCADDGLFCNGTESCDTATSCCTSSGDPCAAGETCDESADECPPSCRETDTICSSEWLMGAIDPVADQDFYTFTGQAGQRVFIQVNRTSGGLNPQIRLFPPSGGPREAIAGDSAFNNHSIAALFEYPLAESGQYTILVLDDGIDDTGDYVLSLLNLSGALTSLQDPDGGPIAFGDTKTGAIDPVVDQDAHTFTGQAGQVVFIQVNRTSGGLNPQIRLFPPSGGPREAIAGDSAFNNHSIAALFEYPLAESGKYTILVLDDGIDDTGEYIMSLSALP